MVLQIIFRVPREMVEYIHKNFKIPTKISNIPENISENLSDVWRYSNNLCVLLNAFCGL